MSEVLLTFCRCLLYDSRTPRRSRLGQLSDERWSRS